MIARTYTPSDVLAALLSLADVNTITVDSERLQRAIYTARDLSSLLDVFVFSESGLYPYSRTLDDAIGRLKLARVLQIENTDYRRFILTPEAKNYIAEKILPQFADAERSALKRAATVVREATVET